MNNSDFNDFKNWQNNGDDENNPFNPHSGFFYYGPMNDKFKKLWSKMNNNEDYMDSMKEYLNMDDIMKDWTNQLKASNNPMPRKPTKKPNREVVFSQDDYLKLIEIRGYLAITEQYAHVKSLDKLLNQIKIIPVNKEKP